MAKKIAFYVENPEVVEIVEHFNPNVRNFDFIVDLYKNYIIVEPSTGNLEITGRKGLNRDYNTESVHLLAYVLTNKED